jgi:excinuclease ABC subunit A
MHFLPDIYVPCDVCKGKKYNRETLEVRYRGKNIFDVLDMTVEEGLFYFENHPQILRKLETLYDVGLGYMKLSQSSTTLSGGEAQRVKLATELSKRHRQNHLCAGRATPGAMADVDRLVPSAKDHRRGHSVIVIGITWTSSKPRHIIDLVRRAATGADRSSPRAPEEVVSRKQLYRPVFKAMLERK